MTAPLLSILDKVSISYRRSLVHDPFWILPIPLPVCSIATSPLTSCAHNSRCAILFLKTMSFQPNQILRVCI